MSSTSMTAPPRTHSTSGNTTVSPAAASSTSTSLYYEKDLWYNDLFQVVQPFVNAAPYYQAASDTQCSFDADNEAKLDALNMSAIAVGNFAVDPVAIETVDGVVMLVFRYACSCLGGLFALWPWVKDRSTTLTHKQAVGKCMDMHDPSLCIGAVIEVSDIFFDHVTREPKGHERQQDDSTGILASICGALDGAEIPNVVGRGISNGPKFVWRTGGTGEFEGGAVGIVLGTSSSEASPDRAAETYAILFRPGYPSVVATRISREHCKNLVEVDEVRAKLAIDAIRSAYAAERGVSIVFFLLTAIIY
jgi:hypothetical protein